MTAAREQKVQRRVALLAPADAGSHAEMIRGFRQANQACGQPVICDEYFTYGLAGHNILATMDEILEKEYDALIPVGLGCTRLAKDGIALRAPELPVISMGVVSHLGSIPENIIFKQIMNADRNMVEAMRFLHACKPDMKSIIIPSEPEGVMRAGGEDYPKWFAEELMQIEGYFKGEGVKTSVVCLKSMMARLDYVKRHLDEIDTIVLVEGTMALDMITELVPLANERGVTVFGGQFDAVRYGCAVGHAVDFTLLGHKASEYVQSFLFNGNSIDDIPSKVRVDHARHAVVNTATAQRQGLDVVHVQKTCTEWGGIMFDTVECDD